MWKTPQPNKRQKGQYFEKLACQYLQTQGLKLIDQNVQYKFGELDLIMKHKEVLVFVEVRYRKQSQFGGALESVNYTKQQKLIRAAQRYLQHQYGNRQPQCRFDVVALQGDTSNDTRYQWIQNAF